MKRFIVISMIALMALFIMPASANEIPVNTGEIEYNLTPLEMAKVTKAEIQAWKEQYAQIYEIESDGKVGYIFDPTCKLSVMKMIAASAQSGGRVVIVESILNNCWLGGDEELRKDEAHIFGLMDDLDELIDLPEYDIDFKKDHAVVTVLGKSCRLRLATRADIKYAEKRNKKNQPFTSSEYLIERLAMDDIKAFKQDTRAFMGLLIAVEEVKSIKHNTLKKL